MPEGRRRTSGCARSRGRSSRTCTGPRDNVRAEVIRRTPAKAFIARYQATLQASGRAVKPAAKPAAKKVTKPAAKKVTKIAAKVTAAKKTAKKPAF